MTSLLRAKQDAIRYRKDAQAKNFYRFGYNQVFCEKLNSLIQDNGRFNFSSKHGLALNDTDSMNIIQHSFKHMLEGNCTREVVFRIQKDVKSRRKLDVFRQG